MRRMMMMMMQTNDDEIGDVMKVVLDADLDDNSSSTTTSTSKVHFQRPRRNVMPKSAAYNNGLLWTEEKELKKALYASLYQSKKCQLSENDDGNDPLTMGKMDGSKKRKSSVFNKDMLDDDGSNTSPKRAKVHAQRKFAQGSNPSSPSVTPVKLRTSSVASSEIVTAKRPKTEDFLTFLCLRGTSLLPSSLDYLNLPSSGQDQGNESRCISPVNSECSETKTKLNTKLPNLLGLKMPSKPPVKPPPLKPVRAHVNVKKPFPKDEFFSSTESSLSDTDDEICKHPEKNKPMIYDMMKKKTIEIDALFDDVPLKDDCEAAMDLEAEKSSAVRALKQKYLQQRYAKKKEAFIRAKKMDVTNQNVGHKNENGETDLQELSCDDNSEKNVRRSLTVEASDSNELKKDSNQTKTAPLKGSHNISTDSVKDLESKPVTRHVALLLKTAKENEQQRKKEKKPRKLNILERSHNTIDLPLLESEHSYVKRLPASPKEEKPPKPIQKETTKVRKFSDFSSDDDVPLAKRTRDAVKEKRANKKAKQIVKSDLNTKKVKISKDPIVSQLVDDIPRTATGRPSRKTKEAATVYLELLGRKLNAPDDDFDMPLLDRHDATHTRAEGKNKSEHLEQCKTTANTKLSRTNAQSTKSNNGKMPVLSANSPSTSSLSSPISESKQSSNLKPKTVVKKVATRSSTLDVMTGLNSERREPVKTREFMKKLTEAQFTLARAQRDEDSYSISSRSRDATPPVKSSNKMTSDCQKKSRSSSLAKKKDTVETKVSSRHSERPSRHGSRNERESSACSAKKKKKSKSSHKSKTRRENWEKSKSKLSTSSRKSKYSKKSHKLKCETSYSSSSKSVPDIKGRKQRRDLKQFFMCDSSSEDTDDDSSDAALISSPVKKFGRHSAFKHPSHIDSTSSDSSSELSYDYPSKPESTTISVRQNVPSTSVAIQVNLMNDLSDLDDDCWEPGFMDGDIENLFSMDHVVTPTLSKGSSPSSPCGTPHRSNRSRDSTPTKKLPVTPDRMESLISADRLKQKTIQKTPPKPSPTTLGSPGPSFSKKRSSPVVRQQKIELPSEEDDDGEDDDNDSVSNVGSMVGNVAEVLDAPVFFPSSSEFQDPMEFIEKIRPEAEKFGVCKIVPPASFKPECKVNDDMRFTAHNQYIHKMLERWGPNMQQLCCIRKHLEAQGIEFDHPPLIGGMELDLPRLFQTVQKYGGLKEVIEKKKWQKVADTMKIAKSAQDRVTKLYDAYCKYLLPYDTLSKEEKLKLEQQVCSDRQRKRGRFADNDECVTKGRSMSLSGFYRIARNTMAMWFKSEPKPTEVEHEYWRCVTEKLHHVCVNAGNIDSSTYGYGFSCNKSSPFAKHQWNLKVLTNSPLSILRCLGPVMGVTIPTLHVGMLFTTGCWYRDPHCLPWIEYLHTGASKIWYGVPASQSGKFREAMNNIVPDYCTKNPIWLPSDTAMVPPSLLIQHGASLCRLVQNSGEFVVVFPRAFTSTMCCGYSVSESVYFAGSRWLDLAPVAFKEISDSCEPPVFSLQRLLIGIANDSRVSIDILKAILPLIKEIRSSEVSLRKQLFDLGLKQFEHMNSFELKDTKKKITKTSEDMDRECEVCRANCYVSLVFCTQDDAVYCLRHAIEHLQKKKKDLKFCKLLYMYDQAELGEMVRKMNEQIHAADNAKKRLCKLATKKTV